MGIFDVSIQKKIKAKEKENLIKYLENELYLNGYEPVVENPSLQVENFRAKNALLKYNLTITQQDNDLLIEGELQQVLIITILILLSILFTQGLGVIVIVAVTYYQKVFTTKYLNMLIDKVTVDSL